jgi:hypothetical protein
VNKPYEQAKRCLEIIEKAIAPLGATREDIIRTRIFVTNISSGKNTAELTVNSLRIILLLQRWLKSKLLLILT